MRMIRGESVETLSRELGVEVYRLEEWREMAMAGMEGGLRAKKCSAQLICHRFPLAIG